MSKIYEVLKQKKLYKEIDLVNYVSYLEKLKTEKTKKDGDWILKNPFAAKITDEKYVEYFERVFNQGLILDGVNITIQSTGISYNYIAYKSKLLANFPETRIDFAEVYEGDEISFEKEEGKIKYKHIILDPFNRDYTKIKGAYCVIKNTRGEFLTILNKDEIEKHRKVAKTDFVWKDWYIEMIRKTIVKKACKQHFEDTFRDLEKADNDDNYNLDNPLEIPLEIKQKIDAINSFDELTAYYNEMKNQNISGFAKAISIKVDELKKLEGMNGNH